MFKKMPFLLIALIVLVSLVEPYLPLVFKSGFYALSLSIKSIIVFILPLIIFSLLFRAINHLAGKATHLMIVILGLLIISNFVATMSGYITGPMIYRMDMVLLNPDNMKGLEPLWSWGMPSLIANDKAMFGSIIIAFLMQRFFTEKSHRVVHILNQVVGHLLKSVLLVIPFFIAGFVLKLSHDGMMRTLIHDYALIFIFIAASQCIYLFLYYVSVHFFNMKDVFKSLKNMLPAAISGFSTMSSAASMPLTLSGVEHFVKNKDAAGTVIPTTVNVHLIGDCIAIPLLAFAVMKSFGVAEPSIISYFIFTLYFVLAKFSVAAIPGGGIIVMLPILESYLGFTSPMMSLITALYVLFDPVITTANILGNGAFAKMIDQFLIRKKRFEKVSS